MKAQRRNKKSVRGDRREWEGQVDSSSWEKVGGTKSGTWKERNCETTTPSNKRFHRFHRVKWLPPSDFLSRFDVISYTFECCVASPLEQFLLIATRFARSLLPSSHTATTLLHFRSERTSECNVWERERERKSEWTIKNASIRRGREKEREKERSVHTISFDSKACTLHYIVPYLRLLNFYIQLITWGKGIISNNSCYILFINRLPL